MALLDELVGAPAHRRSRNGQLQPLRETGCIDADYPTLSIHNRSPGESWVQRQVQPKELIDLAPSPRPPAPAHRTDNAPARPGAVAHSQDDVADLERT